MRTEEQQDNFFTETQQLVRSYVNDRLLLLKYEVLEKATKLASLVFAAFFYILASFFLVIFLSIMGGFYFGELMGSNFYGFAIVSGFYALLLVLFVLLRKVLIDKVISNTIIRSIISTFKDPEDGTI